MNNRFFYFLENLLLTTTFNIKTNKMENVKTNYPYVAIASSKRVKMPIGWAVYKYTRKGIYLCKTKRPKTYCGVSTDFSKAMTNIRNWYSINLPTNGWSDKKSIKVFNGETIEDLLLRIKNL